MTATVFAPDSAQPLAELESIAARVAAVLAGHGVRPGSRVILKADNSAAWVTVLLALAHAGASIVLVDHQDKVAETTRIHRLTSASGGAVSITYDGDGNRARRRRAGRRRATSSTRTA